MSSANEKGEIVDKKQETKVSVFMITYNHERFVEQAIKSIIEQKTDFKFELLIHDDASPDGTAGIINKYVNMYPDIITAIIQKENQFSKGKEITDEFLLPLAKGEYVAFCEGDDFWTDNCKLQKQIDYLEHNKNIPAVSCRYNIVDKDGKVIDISHKGENLNRVYTNEDALRLGAATIHPTTLVMRMKTRRNSRYLEGRKQCCILGGHTFAIYYLGDCGGIYIMEDLMGAWRKVIEECGTSYASRNNEHVITYGMSVLEMYCRYRTFFGSRYDFSMKIAQRACSIIVLLMRKSEKNISKTQQFVCLWRLLNNQDKINMVKYIGKRIGVKLKRKSEFRRV
ncbi:MAG: glycosyltransferase family 2 protein [Lachnospiraceae bacterium]|nr:glycosyltransferase family 2 protein [Lachnospiraceae bacterium]